MVVERAAQNDTVRHCLARGVIVFLWIVSLQISALAEDDPLQEAVNYLLRRDDSQDAPKFWIENHAWLSYQIRNPNSPLDII